MLGTHFGDNHREFLSSAVVRYGFSPSLWAKSSLLETKSSLLTTNSIFVKQNTPCVFFFKQIAFPIERELLGPCSNFAL
ncbi:hypothetical protein LguiA_003572 [Lonicera macranthoides]